MKKKILSICLTAALAVAVLAGCQSESQADSAQQQSAAEAAPAAEATEPAGAAEAAETPEAAEVSGTAEAASASTAAAETAAAEVAAAETAAAVNLIPEDKKDQAPAEGTDFSGLKIGEIESYVVNDGGWCQATHEGILAAMDELGIPKENLIVLEEIYDDDRASTQTAAEELINEGCTLIIGTSTGYASYLQEIAAAHPEVLFAQWGNKVDGLIGYEVRSYEGMFLAGYACELLSAEENPELGFSASYNEESVRTAINAYTLGARYANPEATVRVASADSWYDIDKETQCAQSLIDAGIKYMGMEASSPAIPETCGKNGAFVVGYHNDMSGLAPEAVLVSHMWNFAPIFKNIMINAAEGTATTDDFYYWGGECSSLSDFAAFVPEDVVSEVGALREKIESGEIKIYGGELKDNAGNVLVPDGEVMSDDDIILQKFFVEGVTTSWKAGN
ncbi:MAG: BMP family ABC transporter substrate-binding protein [Eubacteriales bacterium]|nr:BMP family ABC transporter substrate-binding protein [Eubacteriales bacterium]